jgi:hypothetical protein
MTYQLYCHSMVIQLSFGSHSIVIQLSFNCHSVVIRWSFGGYYEG